MNYTDSQAKCKEKRVLKLYVMSNLVRSQQTEKKLQIYRLSSGNDLLILQNFPGNYTYSKQQTKCCKHNKTCL